MFDASTDLHPSARVYANSRSQEASWDAVTVKMHRNRYPFWERAPYSVFDAGFPRVAIAYGRVLVRLAPQSVRAWRTLERLHGRAGDEAAARECLRRALSHRPDSVALITALSERLLTRRDVFEAESLLASATQRHGRHPMILSAQAEVERVKGNFEESLNLVLQAKDGLEKETDPEEYLALATTVASLPGQGALAVEMLEEVAKVVPNDHRPHVALAALLSERDPDSARYHESEARSIWSLNLDFEKNLAETRSLVAEAWRGVS